MVPGFAMDQPLNQGSFTTHTLEIKNCLKLITKKLRRRLRNTLSKNSHTKGFFWPKPRLCKCSSTIHSRCNWFKPKSQKTGTLQLTDVETWSIFALVLTSLQPTKSRVSRSQRTRLLTGWVTRTTMISKECMRFHSLSKLNSRSMSGFKKNWPRETTETLALNKVFSTSLTLLQAALFSKLTEPSFTTDYSSWWDQSTR